MPLNKRKKPTLDKSLQMAQGADCQNCPYLKRPLMADVENDSDRLVVLSAPSENIARDKTWVTQNDDMGKIISLTYNMNGYDVDGCDYTSLVCCVPSEFAPSDKAIECCLPRLKQKLDSGNYTKVLTFGDKVAKSILDLGKAKLLEYRGAWYDMGAYDVLPTYNPKMTLAYFPDTIMDVVQDVKKFHTGKNNVPEVRRIYVHPEPIKTKGDFWRESDGVPFEQVAYQEAIDRLVAHQGDLVFDLETSHKDMVESRPNEWWHVRILACAFTMQEGESYVFTQEAMNDTTILRLLEPVFSRVDGLCGHNIKFDILQVKSYWERLFNKRIEIRISDDTMLMSHNLDERKGQHGLKVLSGIFDEPDYDGELKEYLKNKNSSYSAIPKPILYRYVAKDTDFTFRLLNYFRPLLIEQGLMEWPYKSLALETIPLFVGIERNGFHVSTEKLDYAKTYLSGFISKLKTKLQVWAEIEGYFRVIGAEKKPDNFNPNSYKQLAVIFYDIFNLPQLNGKGITERGTSAPVLKQWLALNLTELQREFIQTLLEYRSYTKLFGTYANKIQNYCDEYGTFHSDYNLIGTVTYRLSAGTILTIPRASTDMGKLIRQIFTAPPIASLRPVQKARFEQFNINLDADNEELAILDSDYSQAELRLAGWYSGDEFLHNVYAENKDLHDAMAQNIFGDDFTKEERSMAKGMNFEYLYSLEEHGVPLLMASSGLPEREARIIADKHSLTLAQCSQWKRQQFEVAKTHGYVLSGTGRYRRFPLITRNNVNDVRKHAVNAPVQGVSSDITILSMSRVTQELNKHKIPNLELLFLHDGTYIAIPSSDPGMIEHATYITKRIMENTAVEIMKNASMRWPSWFGNLEPIIFKADIDIKTAWAGGKEYYPDFCSELRSKPSLASFQELPKISDYSKN